MIFNSEVIQIATLPLLKRVSPPMEIWLMVLRISLLCGWKTNNYTSKLCRTWCKTRATPKKNYFWIGSDFFLIIAIYKRLAESSIPQNMLAFELCFSQYMHEIITRLDLYEKSEHPSIGNETSISSYYYSPCSKKHWQYQRLFIICHESYARAAKYLQKTGKIHHPRLQNHIAKDEIICLWWRLYCRTAMNHGGRRGSASLVWAFQCCVAFTYEIKGTSIYTSCWLAAGGNIRDLFNDMSVDDITKETICHNIFFAKPISQSRSMTFIQFILQFTQSMPQLEDHNN